MDKTSKRFGKRATGAIAATLVVAMTSALSWALPQPLPDPIHGDPGDVLVQSISIDTKLQGMAGRTVTLPRGEYNLFATGVWKNGLLSADAECSLGFLGEVWMRDANPINSALIVGDWIDLYVDNKAVEWSPVKNATSAAGSKTPSQECDQRSVASATPGNPAYDPTSHRYFYKVSWPGGPLNFRIKEYDGDPASFDNNSGTLTVEIRAQRAQVNEELIASVFVPANSPVGVNTPDLIVGERYRLEASGTYQWQSGNKFQADAECWTSNGVNYTNSRAAGDYGYDLLDVSVEESPVGTPNSGADVNVAWAPLSGTGVPGDCSTDASHTYQFSYLAAPPPAYPGTDQTTRLNLRMSDTWGGFFDNVGGILVKVFHMNLSPNLTVDTGDVTGSIQEALDGAIEVTPASGAVPAVRRTEGPTSGGCVIVSGACVTLDIPAKETRTTPSIPSGRYIIEASGSYSYFANNPQYMADPECSTGYPDGTWVRNRFPYYSYTRPDADLLDLLVNWNPVEWRAAGKDDQVSCATSSDLADHVYYTDVQWPGGPITFGVYDGGVYTDRTGTLKVRLFNYVGVEQLIGVVSVNSADLQGSMTPALIQGNHYRLEATGKYTWLALPGMGYDADAECTIKGALVYPPGAHSNDPFWTPHRFDDLYGGDTGDLAIYLPQEADPVNDLQADLRADRRTVTPLDWVPKVRMASPSQDCADGEKDPNRVYEIADYVSPVTGPVNIRVFEPYPYWYTDNVGILTVRIYQKL